MNVALSECFLPGTRTANMVPCTKYNKYLHHKTSPHYLTHANIVNQAQYSFMVSLDITSIVVKRKK